MSQELPNSLNQPTLNVNLTRAAKPEQLNVLFTPNLYYELLTQASINRRNNKLSMDQTGEFGPKSLIIGPNSSLKP